jgi:hypothetical protein
VEWVSQSPMVQSHSQGKQISVFHEYDLRSVDNSKLDKEIRESIKAHRNGAFVFVGHGSRSLYSNVLDCPRAVCAPEAIRKPKLSEKLLPDVPDLASDFSVGTKSSSKC